MNFPFESNRLFQIWAYTVSHSQLLLRSNPADAQDTRIEILFKGVESVQLSASMNGIRIVEGKADEHLPIGFAKKQQSIRSLIPFLIVSDDIEGVVVASSAYLVEEDKEYWESSTIFVGGISASPNSGSKYPERE